MIIATGSVDINEATKLAQEAKANASDNLKKVSGKFDSLLNGKITQSIYNPGQVGDTNSHQKGDLWIVTDSSGYTGTATKMYIYDGTAWQERRWDQQALSVNQLSALTANLGTVNSGTLNSVEVFAKNLTLDVGADSGDRTTGELDGDAGHNPRTWSGKVSQGMGVNFNHGLMHMNAQNNNNGHYDATYIGPNDIKVRETYQLDPGSGLLGRVDIASSGIIIGTSWNDIKQTHLNSDGGVFVGGEFNSLDGIKAGGRNEGYQNDCSISPTSGSDIYFHNKSDNTIAIHTGDIISHGHTIKSTLSSKRSISDISTADALAKVNSTSIKRWQYKDDDNSKIHIGPIIDDVNKLGNKQYSIPNDLINQVGDETGLNESNALSMTMAALQELSKRNDQLSQRVTQLERMVNDAK